MHVPTVAELFANGQTPDILFWVGCAGSFDQRAQKITKAFVTILDKLGINYAILGKEEMCTGDPVRRAGNEFMFQMMAYQNIQVLNNYNIKKIVTACPHCFNTIRNEYPELGGHYEVMTLRQLIQAHPRARFRMEEMEHRHGHRFERVLPKDDIFYLSYAGNHNRGAHFTNLHKEIDEDIHRVFDELSHYTDKFYYGRYDIKTTSIEDLKKGQNFLILEFNGCGAEPNHIYDCNMSIWKAYAEILRHWKALYRISRYNHKNGTPYWSFKRGWNFLKQSGRHFKMLEKYD